MTSATHPQGTIPQPGGTDFDVFAFRAPSVPWWSPWWSRVQHGRQSARDRRLRRSRSIRVANAVFGLLLLTVFTVWFLAFRPQALGGSAGYVMVRGTSMLPTYQTGDLIVVHRHDSYSIGDIVAYRVPADDVGGGTIVIHRIIGSSPTGGFIMEGDNNSGPDPWQPTNDQIVGVPWLVLSRAGFVLAFLHAPLPLASLAAGVAIAFMLSPKRQTGQAKKRQKPEETEG